MNVLFTDVVEFKHQLPQEDVNDVHDGEEITLVIFRSWYQRASIPPTEFQ